MILTVPNTPPYPFGLYPFGLYPLTCQQFLLSSTEVKNRLCHYSSTDARSKVHNLSFVFPEPSLKLCVVQETSRLAGTPFAIILKLSMTTLLQYSRDCP